MTITEERTTFTTENTILTKIPQAGVQRQSSAPVEKRRMGVDEASLNILMDMLTNLYKDPNKSVVQEYISNAIDSHVEAGQTDPVRVTLPTYYSKVFEVADTGVGMSKAEMDEIYSVYGRSTKRDNFDVIGGYGLGSKSALAITSSFTVTSVKDGWKTVMVMTRGEDGGGEIEFPVHVPTDEPNGVKVSIPVTEPNLYAKNVEAFSLGLRSGAITVDGKTPKSYYDDSSRIEGTSTYLVNMSREYYRYYENIYVNIGGVVYEVAMGQIGKPRPVATTITDIAIGAIDLTPSRDSIRYTERTKGFLRELADLVNGKLKEHIESEFLSITGVQESLEFARKYMSVLRESKDNIVAKKYGGLYHQRRTIGMFHEDSREPGGFDQQEVSYASLGVMGDIHRYYYIIVPEGGYPRGVKTWIKRWNDTNYNTPVKVSVQYGDRRAIRMMRRAGWRPLALSALQTLNREILEEQKTVTTPKAGYILDYFTRSAEGYNRRRTVEDLLDYDIIINYNLSDVLMQYIAARTGKSLVTIDTENKKPEALVKRLNKAGYVGEFWEYDYRLITRKLTELLTDHDKLCMYAHGDLTWAQRDFISDMKAIRDSNVSLDDPQIDETLELLAPEMEFNDSVYYQLRRYVDDSVDTPSVDRGKLAQALAEKYPMVSLDTARRLVVYSNEDELTEHVAAYINFVYATNNSTTETKDN